MVISKRISRLEKELKRLCKGKEYSNVIIKAKEGLFLIDLTINKTIGNYKTPIDRAISGYEINDFSNTSIDDILIIGNGDSMPIIIYGALEDDYIEALKTYADENNVINLKDLSNNELNSIINI
ncbi:hypothetical protein [Clostridium saccharoperbutylacetonicum]